MNFASEEMLELWHKINCSLTTKERNLFNSCRSQLWILSDASYDMAKRTIIYDEQYGEQISDACLAASFKVREACSSIPMLTK